MKNILIYKSQDNLHVTHFVKNLNTDEITQQAENLLPFGTLYRIGTVDELPEDRTFRDAWDLDDSDYNGIAGKITTIKKIANLDHSLLNLREKLASLVQIPSLSFSDTKSEFLQFNDAIQEQQQQVDDLQQSIHSLEAQKQEQQNTLQQLIAQLPNSPQNDQN